MDLWIAGHWPELLLAAAALIKILNVVTRHFRDHQGVVKWCLFAIDLLDVVKTSHGGTHGGIPGSRPPVNDTGKRRDDT